MARSVHPPHRCQMLARATGTKHSHACVCVCPHRLLTSVASELPERGKNLEVTMITSNANRHTDARQAECMSLGHSALVARPHRAPRQEPLYRLDRCSRRITFTSNEDGRAGEMADACECRDSSSKVLRCCEEKVGEAESLNLRAK